MTKITIIKQENSEVDENAAYNVRFENGKSNVNDLLFHDFKCGLKIFFH